MNQTSAPQTSAPSSAPAPSAAPTAPSFASSPARQLDAPGVYTPSDIFAEFERKIGLSDDTQQDLSTAKKYEDVSIEDLYSTMGDRKEEQSQESGQEAGQQEQISAESLTESAPQVEDSDEMDYKFEATVGDEDKAIHFKSKAQLNKAITKAIVADKIYKNYKELQARIPELEESARYAARVDEMLEKDPGKFLDTITEDMDEDTLKGWLIAKAEHLSRDKSQRDLERKLKHAEYLERQMEQMQQQQQQLKQDRVRAAQEADKHAVNAWGEGILSKVRTRVPEQYYGMMKDVLQSSVLEARQRQKSNETVTIKTLDAIFARRAKPLMELINERGGDKKTVQAEVGRAIESKKQDGLSRIQQAASSLQAKRQTPQGRDFNVSEVFDDLISGVGAGRYKMKG